MSIAKDVAKDLKKLGSPAKAKTSAWFFKTAKGQYGYGDVFVGVTVPEQRNVAKRHADISFAEIDKLLKDKVHEFRFTALVILVKKYESADDDKERERVVDFYISHLSRVNNWDLVDTSAPYILGKHLLDKERSVLYDLVKSKDLWRRRVAIISTFAFIKAGDYKDTLKISEILLLDSHDLIHKAIGWMLREVGKRSLVTEKQFLEKYAATMPRTALRYAIERFPEEERQKYLKRSSEATTGKL